MTEADSLKRRFYEYIRQRPNASNQELYERFPDIKKGTVRYYKSQWRDGSLEERYEPNGNGKEFEITDLNPENLEEGLLQLIREKGMTEQIMRIAIDFYHKIKDVKDNDFDQLDLEQFYLDGKQTVSDN